MGMAASQARYLALTARKTNTEYEGQQINQARTALANQSANLFNRLLDLKVPTAPKTTDFTELQYSYSDGDNESVIDSWKQLSSADPNYNYVVNHYYYTDVYTGSQKLLSNPQVTTKGEVKEDRINTRIPAPTVEYETDASGNMKIKVSGSDGTKTYSNVYLPYKDLPQSTKLDNAIKDVQDAKTKAGVPEPQKDDFYGYQDSTGTWHFLLKEDVQKYDPIDYTTEYKPSAVGNSPLTELKLPLEKDTETALSQIIKDVPDSNLKDYLSFNPTDGLVYSGQGVYSFEMAGKTYYTCDKDLYNSMQTQNEYGKPIEGQEKLAYYGASMVRQKIEATNNALIETDGNGRFKSVKFDNDSVVYTLNTETITNEAAYQDAMNQYNHEVAQYEKTIADINAKTSIIQKEDRTLELRLKQLDTEQNALKTEMEAVKKVIKDNVESTFKTFSD